jgi:hypothetical protein
VQGVFTKALLAGLRGGACDPSGRITAETLRDFIINDVAARAKENEEQRPRIIAPDSIVFAEGRAPQGAHVTVNFPRPENVSAEVVDGALKVVARGAANAPLLVEKLPPGLYKVRVAAAPPREQFFQITSELKVTFDFTA